METMNISENQLEQLLREGLDSGEPTEMTKQDWDDIRQEALSRIKARKASKARR